MCSLLELRSMISSVVAPEKAFALPVERETTFLEVHQMRGPANFHISPQRRLGQRGEQPARVGVKAHSVPFAADDRDRRMDPRRIIGKLAGPGVIDILEC